MYRIRFKKEAALLKAVDHLSFSLRAGEILSLVGESGCGKSTCGRLLLRLLDKTSGQVFCDGRDLFSLNRADLHLVRRDMQIIFQDPFSSLNPRHNVGSIISEPLDIYGAGSAYERAARVVELMDRVGMSPRYRRRYPHEFSGGQRQRIGIARALSLNPRFIVCDEPVYAALDVSVQAQVINLLLDLQQERNLTYLFISHDLSIVRHISHRAMVMYLGAIVESVPQPDPRLKRGKAPLVGDVPSPINLPPGCRFNTRCPKAFGRCREAEPAIEEIYPGHFAVCYRAKE